MDFEKWFHCHVKVLMLQNCGTRSDMGGVGELIGMKLQIACRTAHCNMHSQYTLQYAHCTAHCNMNAHCTAIYIAHYTLRSVRIAYCTLQHANCNMYTATCTLQYAHYTLHSAHSTDCTLHHFRNPLCKLCWLQNTVQNVRPLPRSLQRRRKDGQMKLAARQTSTSRNRSRKIDSERGRLGTWVCSGKYL